MVERTPRPPICDEYDLSYEFTGVRGVRTQVRILPCPNFYFYFL